MLNSLPNHSCNRLLKSDTWNGANSVFFGRDLKAPTTTTKPGKTARMFPVMFLRTKFRPSGRLSPGMNSSKT